MMATSSGQYVPDCPKGSGVHPFGCEVSVTQDQLLTAFFNHLYLGQWELASACATSLENLQGSDDHVDIRAVLRAIIKYPHDISLGLDSISSPHQLAWLASLHLKQEAWQKEDLSADDYGHVEFRLLLYLANYDAGPAVLQEVFMYYKAVQLQSHHQTLVQKQMPLHYLSKDCFKFLLSTLTKDATLGHTIIQHLLLPNQHRAEENNLSLHQLYITCLRDCISSLESMHDKSNLKDREQTVQLIYSLLNYLDSPISEVPKLHIEDLFTSLLRLAIDYPGLLCEASLTAILVGRDSDVLLRTFLKVQSSVRWERVERDVNTSHPQLKCMCPELRINYAFSKIDDREDGWRNLLHWVLENDQHVLSKIVELSLTLIREKMYDELSNLLQPKEFTPLRPLILLLGWGHVDSCSAAERLLHTLWRKQHINGEDDLLQQACQRLHQDVQLIQWCLEQAKPLIAKYDGEPSLEQKATAMFQGADTHSVLRLLYHFTNLSMIDPMEGFHILNSIPQLESALSNGNEVKTVRFADDKKKVDQKRNCTIYRSLLAIGNVVSALMHSANPPQTNQEVDESGTTTIPIISVASAEVQDKARSGTLKKLRDDQQKSSGNETLKASKSENVEDKNTSWQTCVVGRLTTAREHLFEIVPLTYRVEILENLFSVLFARYGDIQTLESDVVMSDSGGEEGHVDEEWNNMGFNTSLESVESPVKEGSLLTEFTFSPILEKSSSVTENRSSMNGLSKDRSQSASEATLTPTLLDKMDVLESADVQRLKYGKRTSSETTNSLQSYLNHFGSSVNKVGFLTNRRFMQDLLTMLKECIEDVNAAKLANMVSKEPSQGSSDDLLQAHIVTSVPQAHLAQHIAQLTKRINEARWRFQLVSSHQAKDEDEGKFDEIAEEEVVIKKFFEARRDENGGGKKKRKRSSSKQSQSRSRSASGWSSSEPGSGNHSTHSQTRLSAGPLSTGTSSGNERRRRRKHKKCSTDQGSSITPKPHHQDCSIVAQMLASEDTLLRMCLRRGNFAQAQQVIKIFDMKDKPEVSEVHFASHWQQAVSKLKIFDKSKKGSSSNATVASSQQQVRPGGILGSIASMAAAGIASLSLTGVVDDLLNNATLPILPQLDDINGGMIASPGSRRGSNGLWQQLKAINISAMVVFDLACTSSHSWKTCSELLEVVMSRLQVASDRGSPVPEVKITSPSQLVSSPKVDQSQSLLGIPAFIEQLYNLINPMSSSSTALIRPDVLDYFQRCASDALTTVSAPLDPSTLRAHVNFVIEVRRGLEQLTKALQAYQADEDSGLSEFSLNFSESPNQTSSPKRGAPHRSPKQSPVKTTQKVSEIQISAQMLLIALDKNVMPSFMMAFPKNHGNDEQPINPANYLLTLYNHLSVLASLAHDAQGWQPGSERQLKVERDLCQNPFSILAESPSLLLGRLMFANKIPPVRLESVASELKLNLVQIIMQSCCPAIPMLPHSVPHSPVHQTSPRPSPGDYVTVLNEGGVAGEWPHPVRRPCVVIEELLNKIISLMIKHISGDGSDVAFELSSACSACITPEYWDIVMSTRELIHVDLDLLQSHEDKLCFFTNLLNLMLAHGALHHAALQTKEKGNNFSLGHTRHHSLGRGTTNPASIMLTPPGINSGMVLDQLVYLSSMAYRVGQMGVISVFDLHFVILRSNLPVPLVYGDVLQHRLHALGEDDPWLKYIPSPDSRITFVSCNGSASSPRLRVLTVDDLDEQLTLAMQNHLEAGVRVDEKLNQIVIPQSLEWFRKDFTGSTLPADIDHGNVYMGLLSVIIPHVSQYLGDKLENYTMRYLPRHIELESSAELAKVAEMETGQQIDRKPPLLRANSMRFKLVVAPFDHTFRYRFYGPTDNKTQQSPIQRRRLSVPDNFDSSGLGWSLKEESAAEPPFSMTEPTLKYLHSKSKLVASLAGVVSAGIGESTDDFAKDKSFDEDLLPSSIGSPASLVFEDTFGSERTYNPRLTTLTKVLQHLAGYPIMQHYIQSFFSEVVSIAGSSRGSEHLNELEVRAGLLADIRCKEIQDLLKEAVELLVSECQWEAVLRLVDTIRCISGTGCYDAIRDFAAYCAGNQVKGVQMNASSKPTWQCLLTIGNKTLRGRAVLASLDSLPIEDALELVECCVLDYRKDSPLSIILHTKLQQLKMYRKITFYAMQYTPPLSLEVLQGGSTPADPSEVIRPLCTWQDVQDASKTSPDNVLKLLMSASDFDLAKDWAEIHGVIEDYQQTIQINQLEHLLSSSSNNLQVYQILEDTGSNEETVLMCTQLLESQKIALPSVVFLVQYLLHNCFDELSLDRAGKLHDISIGAKVLLCLPERVRGEYQHLMSRPDLLLEQLLMNLKMNLASDVQATLQEELRSSQFPSASLSEISINTLISKYAREAIQIPVALLNTSMSDTDSALNQSFALASYASALSPIGLVSALKGRQFLASMRGRAPSPSPSSVSSSSIPVPERRRLINRGPSPGITSPGPTSPPSRRMSRDGSSSQNPDLLVSPSSARPSMLPDVPEKPLGVSLEGGELPAVPPTRDQWVPDDKVTNCMVCQDRFSMFNRRHHCRRCGRVVCWKCSQLRAVVDGYGDTPVRICDQCYERFIAPRSYGTPQSLEQRMKGKMSGGRASGGSGSIPAASRSFTPSQTPELGGMGGEGLTEFDPVTEWRLSLDEEYSSMIREDFYYEQAPSTSLCLSILELHSDPGICGHLILQLCQRLSEYLRPIRPGEPNTEVDYSLILSMMRTLLLNSKLKFLGSGDSASLELCDTYLGHVDLLNMFVSSNCTDIPSIQQLTKMDTARRIRDKLVLSERLSLAMEVSTKCGLDPGAVWAAWGLSCLQAGDYEGAREKLTKILKAPIDKNQTEGPNRLLQEIIKILESSAGHTVKVQDILTLSASSIKDFISQPYKSAPESEKLNENTALKECVHYIHTYSSHFTTVQFYMRHSMSQKAVSYILQQQCSSEVFLEGLLVPCIKEGQFSQLQEHMLRVDPSLVKWHPYLTASCRHVNRLGWSHILYQMQLFMKDFVRAAMTCIKFFQAGATSYSDLFERLHHVNRAKDHMTAVMDDKQWGSVPRPSPGSPSSRGWGGTSGGESNIRLNLTPSELTKHLNTISLQIEVTTFLHRHLGKNSLVPPTSPTAQANPTSPPAGLARKQSVIGGGPQPSSGLPTLFGNSMEKADVVHKVLLAGMTIEEGFQLAFKIVQDFRLAETKIYSRAGRRLSLLKKFSEVKLLLKCHKDTGLANKESCDEILDACVRALVGDKAQVKGAEELIKLMQGDTSKINAYILIGRLRQAYLLAVKGEREHDVRRIAKAAEQAEASGVKLKAICDQWLRDYEAKRRNAEQTKEVLARSKAARY